MGEKSTEGDDNLVDVLVHVPFGGEGPGEVSMVDGFSEAQGGFLDGGLKAVDVLLDFGLQSGKFLVRGFVFGCPAFLAVLFLTPWGSGVAGGETVRGLVEALPQGGVGHIAVAVQGDLFVREGLPGVLLLLDMVQDFLGLAHILHGGKAHGMEPALVLSSAGAHGPNFNAEDLPDEIDPILLIHIHISPVVFDIADLAKHGSGPNAVRVQLRGIAGQGGGLDQGGVGIDAAVGGGDQGGDRAERSL